MVAQHFSHVTTWVFDLDNTLYPPEVALFDQIEVRMTAWVAEALDLTEEEASRVREDYWRRFGTTLAGLMDLHGVDPGPYLSHVHDISLDHMMPDPDLRTGIVNLSGRRIVYTNGTADYAERVTAALGLTGVFDAIYGVEDAGFRPKPEKAAFARVFGTDGLIPSEAAMFEDDTRNLLVPHALGMRTVHVAPEPHPDDPAHIHHHTENLNDFLFELKP